MTSSAGIALEHRGQRVVAHVSGELDVTNAGPVGENLLEALDNDSLGLVIDLSAVRYLDSAAVEMLFETARRLRRRRQGVALVVPPESPLVPVVDLTRLDSAATVHDSVQAALAGR